MWPRTLGETLLLVLVGRVKLLLGLLSYDLLQRKFVLNIQCLQVFLLHLELVYLDLSLGLLNKLVHVDSEV